VSSTLAGVEARGAGSPSRPEPGRGRVGRRRAPRRTPRPPLRSRLAWYIATSGGGASSPSASKRVVPGRRPRPRALASSSRGQPRRGFSGEPRAAIRPRATRWAPGERSRSPAAAPRTSSPPSRARLGGRAAGRAAASPAICSRQPVAGPRWPRVVVEPTGTCPGRSGSAPRVSPRSWARSQARSRAALKQPLAVWGRPVKRVAQLLLGAGPCAIQQGWSPWRSAAPRTAAAETGFVAGDHQDQRGRCRAGAPPTMPCRSSAVRARGVGKAAAGRGAKRPPQQGAGGR